MQKCSQFSAAKEILESIEAQYIPADKVLAYWVRNNRYAGAKDKNAIASLVYGVLRHKACLEWWLKAHVMPVNIRGLLVTYLALTKANVEVYFDESVRFSQSDLTRKEREYVGDLEVDGAFSTEDMPDAVRWNMPTWLAEKFETFFGESSEQEALAMNDEAPVDIRINTLKASVADVLQACEKEKIPVNTSDSLPNGLRLKRRIALSGLEMFRKGWIEVQDAGAQLTCALINAKKGDKVVDFCAGAGGKSLALAAAMENTGRIIACDVSEKRLERSGIRLRRAGVNNVERRTLTSEKDKWVKRRAVRFDGGFDKVVADVPCSGTGTWRRNPDQKWRLTPESLEALIGVQKSILANAARLVRRGGRLIYITCSVLPEENAQQVNAFLEENKEFHAVDMKEAWQEMFQSPAPAVEKYIQLTPHRTQTDGFFIAV